MSDRKTSMPESSIPESFHDLVPVQTRDIGGALVQTVNARQLHDAMDVGRDFSNWVKDRIGHYGFQEGIDFIVVFGSPNPANQKGRGGDRRSIEYHLTLDTAKEVAMVEDNERGRAIRRYLIACEKTLREVLALAAGGDDRNVLGGIVKGVVNKAVPLALREFVRVIIRECAPGIIAELIAADPRVAVGEYVSVRELLDEGPVIRPCQCAEPVLGCIRRAMVFPRPGPRCRALGANPDTASADLAS
jgi:phage anti-repressor protein